MPAATAAVLLALSSVACQGAPQQSAPQKLDNSRSLAATAQKGASAHKKSPFRNPSKEPPPPRSGDQLADDELAKTIETARKLAEDGTPVGAIRELRKCANKIPQSPRCEAELGLLLADEKMRQADALYYLTEAVKAPDASADADLYRRLGDMLRSKGKSADAARAYQYLLEREPENAENHARLATALQGVAERIEEAADALAEASKLDASELQWKYDEGLLRAQIAGQTDRAITLLEEYLEKTRGQNTERDQILLGRIAELRSISELEKSGKPAAERDPAKPPAGGRPVQ